MKTAYLQAVYSWLPHNSIFFLIEIIYCVLNSVTQCIVFILYNELSSILWFNILEKRWRRNKQATAEDWLHQREVTKHCTSLRATAPEGGTSRSAVCTQFMEYTQSVLFVSLIWVFLDYLWLSSAVRNCMLSKVVATSLHPEAIVINGLQKSWNLWIKLSKTRKNKSDDWEKICRLIRQKPQRWKYRLRSASIWREYGFCLHQLIRIVFNERVYYLMLSLGCDREDWSTQRNHRTEQQILLWNEETEGWTTEWAQVCNTKHLFLLTSCLYVM